MNADLLIFILLLICAMIVFYFNVNPDMTYVKSDIDNTFYLVRDVSDKQQASNTLAKIKQHIITLSDYLYNNIDDKNNEKYKEYIIRLHDRARDIIIIESTQDSIYTSYSINKGEQIVFCLRTRQLPNSLHDINLMMYVVLHEISHVACPIYDNHGPLFKEIFAFITTNAINIGIYNRIDFRSNPTDYCGLMITDSII